MSQHPLLAYAERSGVTVTAIAEKAGCSRMTLYRLVNGEQNATIDLLRRVSEATGGEVPVEAFLATPDASELRAAS